ncbi:MAG: type II toxin-antitoxin system VapC family toxin [Saprospiraceae bacterium]
MSYVVIDTHIIIWDRLAPERLSTKARKSLTEADVNHQIIICEISLWEIAMLIKKKRIIPDLSYTELMEEILHSRNYILQGITPEIAYLASELEIDTKDPADRLIAATSISLDLPLITADQHMLTYDRLKTIW